MKKTRKKAARVVTVTLEEQRRVAEAIATKDAGRSWADIVEEEEAASAAEDALSRLSLESSSSSSSVVEVVVEKASALDAALRPYRTHGFAVEWAQPARVAVVFFHSAPFAQDALARIAVCPGVVSTRLASDANVLPQTHALLRKSSSSAAASAAAAPPQRSAAVARRMIAAHLGLSRQVAAGSPVAQSVERQQHQHRTRR